LPSTTRSPQVFASSYLTAAEYSALLGRAVDQRARNHDAPALNHAALISRTRLGALAGHSNSTPTAPAAESRRPWRAEVSAPVSDRRTTNDPKSDDPSDGVDVDR
jgi:hypothetical protein